MPLYTHDFTEKSPYFPSACPSLAKSDETKAKCPGKVLIFPQDGGFVDIFSQTAENAVLISKIEEKNTFFDRFSG